MGGGLMQLVAYGAQDIYLTGNPQITFFKVIYRRHTNFSMESIKQSFDGVTRFGGRAVATISRNGDLVHRMYLEHDAVFINREGESHEIGLCERYGDSLIKECEIEIGGQRIDKHTSMWNRVYSDLTEFNPTGYFGLEHPSTPPLHSSGDGTLHQLMTGNGHGFHTTNHPTIDGYGGIEDGDTVNGFTYRGHDNDNPGITVNKIFLPLNFWFCRDPGQSLPLIALQYHEVKIKMTFEKIQNLVHNVAGNGVSGILEGPVLSSQTSTVNFDLWCDYIYLDTDERRRFAQVSHEYLIEQLQYSDHTVSNDTTSIELNFNHPVKELIWCSQNVGQQGRNGPVIHTSGKGKSQNDPTASPVTIEETLGEWQLKLNGHERISKDSRDIKYFTRTQVWQHHTGYGGLPTMIIRGLAGDLGIHGASRQAPDLTSGEFTAS